MRGSPLGLVVQARRRVQVHHLIVLHGEVLPRALQMRHLHRAVAQRIRAQCQEGCGWGENVDVAGQEMLS